MNRALFALVLCAAPLVEAGWSNVRTITGTPQDLVVADAGLVVVSSSGAGGVAMALFADGGTWRSLPPGNYVGAGLSSSTCLLGLQANQAFSSAGTCSALPAFSSGALNPVRFRVTPAGAGLIVATSSFDELFTASAGDGSYAPVGATWIPRVPRSLGVVSVGPEELAVFNQSAATLQYSTNGGAPLGVSLGFSSRDAVPFSLGGAAAVLAITSAGGVMLIPDLRAGAPGSRPIALPPGSIADSVAMTTDEGAAPKRGYGLITTAGGAVYAPIPDPDHVGERWVLRPEAPALSGRVHCLGSSWCAGFGASGEVYVLENAAAPTFTLDAGALSSGVASLLEVDAGDADGDPIFVTWSSAGASFSFPDGGPLDHHRAEVLATIQTCSATVPILVTVWDGHPGHETQASFEVPVTSQALGVPRLEPRGVIVAAGSGPVAFTASLDGGCQPLGPLVWSPGGSTANPFVWTPPTNVCLSSGLQVPISFDVGARSASTTVTVTPWGPALTPVFPSSARQDAGTSVRWQPLDEGHVCASAGGFPGTVLDWTFDAGPFGVTILDGGLLLDAPACTPGTFHALATRSVPGTGTQSGAGALDVEIVSGLAPLSAATGFSMGLQFDAGASVAFGTFSVDADCLERRSLEARVELLRPGGERLAGLSAPVPGPWSLPVPAGCSGGDYRVRAELLEARALTGAVDQGALHAEQVPVLAGALTPSLVEVQCGTGGHGTLTLAAPPGSCLTAGLGWSTISGPEVRYSNPSGRSVDLQTADTSFSLIGRELRVAIALDGGVGDTAQAERTVTFTGPRFVALETRLTPLDATSEAPLEVELTMTNTSACEVDAVSLVAQLNGLVPDLDSLRSGSRALGASLDGGVIVLDGVALAPQASRVVHLSARPRLLATPSVAPSAFVRGVPVDLAPGAGVPAGCGCSSTGPLPIVMLGAWRMRRRRREELS